MEEIFTTSIFHAPLERDIQLLTEQGVTVYEFMFAYQVYLDK